MLKQGTVFVLYNSDTDTFVGKPDFFGDFRIVKNIAFAEQFISGATAMIYITNHDKARNHKITEVKMNFEWEEK